MMINSRPPHLSEHEPKPKCYKKRKNALKKRPQLLEKLLKQGSENNMHYSVSQSRVELPSQETEASNQLNGEKNIHDSDSQEPQSPEELSSQETEASNQLFGGKQIHDSVSQVGSGRTLDPKVEDLPFGFSDDFIASMEVDLGCEAPLSSSEMPLHLAGMTSAEIMEKTGLDGIFNDDPKAGQLALSALQFPADIPKMEQDFNSLIAFGQRAIPQGFLALNVGLSYLIRVVKAQGNKIKQLVSKVKLLEEEKGEFEEKLKQAVARAEEAEKARDEMAKSVKYILAIEVKAKREVQAKLAEVEASLAKEKAKTDLQLEYQELMIDLETSD